jgi:YidC/Oxa1 family membrane protein insertase
MYNQRLILFFGLILVLFLMWEAWTQDYGPKPAAVATTQTAVPLTPDSPKDVPAAQLSTAAPLATPEAPKAEEGKSSQRIHVTTDTFDLIIDSRGGDIREVDLRKYAISSSEPDKPFKLMKDTLPNLFVAQSGLLSSAEAPDHYALFTAEKSEYTLAEGQNELRVPLVWQGSNGVKVTKTLIFTRGNHYVDIDQKVENGSAEVWSGRQYRQLQRSRPDGSNSSFFIQTYTGGVIYSEAEKYEKIEFDDMASSNLSRDITDGWGAMIQHYFLAAFLPAKGETNHFYTKAPGDDRFVLGLISPAKTVQAGQSDSFTTRLYIGPKEQNVLETLAPSLELTVDYGMLTIIAKPLFWVMEWFHSLVNNWGWSILMVTLIIKLAFYPLSAASYRSMANMRKFAPKLQQLKERYGDDRQRMSQAMMELYKKEKVNPLGGCLPMIVQIPVFIALYWVLLESVELRQAPFILWIQDLSIKDPYYVLPLLMGISMFIQQKLNPAPPDPIQAKVMMALPIIFTLFFAFFPAGLVLYWLANSVLSVAQQWYITVKIERADAAAGKS